MTRTKLLFAMAAFLTGCTVVSDAIDLGEGRYSMTAQHKRAWTSAEAQALAVENANKFCAAKEPGARAIVETVQGHDADWTQHSNAMIIFHCKAMK